MAAVIGSAIKSIFRHPQHIIVGILILLTIYVLMLHVGPQCDMAQRQPSSPPLRRRSKSARTNHDRRPRRHLVYVKIEKTGSSTMSNIISSYGYRHRLNMMMSTIKESVVNTRELRPTNSWCVGPCPGPPDMMEQHARYNKKFYSSLFPGDTVYIASIRNPQTWFISYVDFMKTYRGTDPREVLHTDSLFYKKRSPRSISRMQFHVHNNMLQWLGFDVYQSSNETAIQEYIQFLGTRFSLILLNEYFDESLILLKRLMNWKLVDIFYSYANEAKHKSGVKFTEQENTILIDRSHNLGDWLLYEHFNQSFWQKVNSEPGFFEEVRLFRKLNAEVKDICNDPDMAGNVNLRFETEWDGVFYVNEEDCIGLRIINGAAPELSDTLDNYITCRGGKKSNGVIKHILATET